MTTALEDTTDIVRPELTRQRGRTTVAMRALDSLVSAVAADTFGVTARAVQVGLSDQDGLLTLEVRTPIRVVTLERMQHDPVALERSGGTLIQRAACAQATIRERVTELTGAEIAHVAVRITGIDTRAERRVR